MLEAVNIDPNSSEKVKRAKALVIGYGAAGIASVKELKTRFDVVCFEARSQAGGVWNYSANPDPLKLGFDPEGRPVMLSSSERVAIDSACQSSAIYECLHANLPHCLMAYRGTSFENTSSLFPPHTEVAKYLKRVSKEKQDSVSFSTLVTRCRHNPDQKGRRWLVNSKNLQTGFEAEDSFDYIVAASGHYSIPYVPYYDGLWLWSKPVNHGREYRRPSAYSGKNVMIVGARASGYDIARDIAEHLYKTEGESRKIYQSVREESRMFSRVSGPASKIVQVVPAIRCFDETTITLEDGTVIVDVDVVVFTTGYLFSFPFCRSEDEPFKSSPLYKAPLTPKSHSRAIGSDQYPPGGLAVHNLDALNLFYYPDQTLALPALHYQVVPFLLAQVHARYITRLWADAPENATPQPGLDGLHPEGWASDDVVRASLYIGQTQFQYEDDLMTKMGEGGVSDKGDDFHEDGRLAFNPAWRQGIRISANVLKRAVLGY